VVKPRNFAKLNRVDHQARVTVASEPRAVMLIRRFVAATNAIRFDLAMSANVKNRRERSLDFFWQPKIGGDVKVRTGLEMNLLHHNRFVFEPPGDRRVQIAPVRRRRESKHIEKLRPSAGSPFRGLEIRQRSHGLLLDSERF
jgi:hypothetical protein